MPDNRYSINSVLRALKILDAFGDDKNSFSNTELSERLDLNKSTITTLLSSLVEGGFLEKDEQTRRYKLTHRLYRLGMAYIQQVDMHKVTIPLLKELSKLYNESVHIGFLSDYRIVNMQSIESTQPVTIRIDVNTPHDAHSSAIGKVLLANLDAEDIETYLRSTKLKRYTPNTITSPSELINHLRRVKEYGYAIDDGELYEDVRCVGAPIYDDSSKAIAAISISAPSFRMTREKMEKEFISAIKNTAAKISKKLGYLKNESS